MFDASAFKASAFDTRSTSGRSCRRSSSAPRTAAPCERSVECTAESVERTPALTSRNSATNGSSALGACLLFGVMLTEIQRAKTGWMDPDEAMQELRPEYTPGDLGFDPLGMAPKTDADMLAMKNKELNNGRLAMMAVAGIVAQEVVTGQELLGSA